MLPHTQVDQQAKRDGHGHYNFRPMLSAVRPLLSNVDLAICHQETPISDNDVGVSGYPSFNGPLELAAAEKWAGYAGCDTASNHTYDLGAGGVRATIETLDRFGLKHSGSYASAAAATRPTIYDVKVAGGDVRVGHLAYTYGLNGKVTPDAPWMVNLLEPVSRIWADARALKRRDDVDIVVVSVHAGIEGRQAPSAYQQRIDAQIMRSADVDLVVGAHAHVVQPVKRLADGRWIIYGLGNFLAEQQIHAGEPPIPNRDGVIVESTFALRGGRYVITKMGFVPTFDTLPGDRVVLAPPAERARVSSTIRAYGAPAVDVTP